MYTVFIDWPGRVGSVVAGAGLVVMFVEQKHDQQHDAEAKASEPAADHVTARVARRRRRLDQLSAHARHLLHQSIRVDSTGSQLSGQITELRTSVLVEAHLNTTMYLCTT